MDWPQLTLFMLIAGSSRKVSDSPITVWGTGVRRVDRGKTHKVSSKISPALISPGTPRLPSRGQVTEVVREGVWVALKLGGPMLILSMMVGVFIAIFQAVTQIHEQTLSFILKLTVVILVLLVGGGQAHLGIDHGARQQGDIEKDIHRQPQHVAQKELW